MRFIRTPVIGPLVFPEALFRFRTAEKRLYLTFDDGPDPESTPGLLDMLGRFNVKALFFCRGDAAERYPAIITRMKEEGHLTGNHGYSHLRGWRTSFKNYCEDVKRAAPFTSGKLFRPPFGSITFWQFRELKKSFSIIFWDVMAYDFDPSFGPERSLNLLKKKIRPGSIIVLHDSPNSTCRYFLDRFLRFALNQGYRFASDFDQSI